MHVIVPDMQVLHVCCLCRPQMMYRAWITAAQASCTLQRPAAAGTL